MKPLKRCKFYLKTSVAKCFGAAANLAGIPKSVFLSKLADYGVDTFHLSESELAEDLANA
jgi:predicted HTH domain antitoxin